MNKKIFLMLFMLSAMFFTSSKAYAGSGYTLEDAIELKENEKVEKLWNRTTDSYDCYNKIVINAPGILKFNMTKPVASYKYGSVFIYLLRSDGTEMYKAYFNDASTKYNEFSFGLNPGVYYINIDSLFSVKSGYAKSEYYYTFDATKYSEIETNNTYDTANTMNLNRMYTGFIGRTDNDDYYSINLTSGLKTRLYIENFIAIKDTTVILSIYDPYRNSIHLSTGNIKYDVVRRQHYFEFIPEISGKYYVRVYNYSGNQFEYKVGVYQNKTYNISVIDEINNIASKTTQDSIPVYRMYNRTTGEHLYTTDAYEVSVIYKNQDWGYEGIGWYTLSTGTPVYRLYNPKLGNHLYTTDTYEISVITKTQGWLLDFDGKPVMYSNGEIPIYRLYNQPLNGQHHLTTDFNEYTVLPSEGWKQEGISMYASVIGKQNITEYYNVSF